MARLQQDNARFLAHAALRGTTAQVIHAAGVAVVTGS